MQRFQNILVGVDLLHGSRPTALELNRPTEEAVDRAIWLAELTGARLTFASVLGPSDHAEHLDDQEAEHIGYTVEEAAREVLAKLVHRAQQHNIAADGELTFGTPWEEITRQVLRNKHDLVVVGTRDRSGITRLLFGSTAMRLIHNCPCPVWVTKPDPTPETLNILVASDLSEVSLDALQIVVSGAQVVDAKIHLLHSIEFPLERQMWLTGVDEGEVHKYRTRVREHAEQELHNQLAQTDYRTLTHGVMVHVIEGPPDTAILDAIDEHEIDLVVLGTVVRTGLPGVLIGTTAERLLPQIPCSLLAVKPRGFVSPITLPAES